jgi:hypothetical protein
MKLENIVFLGVGAMIGWYLALNKKKETEQALNLAQREASQLANELRDVVMENDRLASLSVTEDVGRETSYDDGL